MKVCVNLFVFFEIVLTIIKDLIFPLWYHLAKKHSDSLFNCQIRLSKLVQVYVQLLFLEFFWILQPFKTESLFSLVFVDISYQSFNIFFSFICLHYKYLQTLFIFDLYPFPQFFYWLFCKKIFIFSCSKENQF